ncbi:MAG: exopolysaccharide biosynthesis protein [Nitrospirota bacterium]
MTHETDQRPTRLSDDLRAILDRAAGNALSLRQIVEVLHGRGFDVLVIILVLPFCQPIPLPGLSTPFGLALMFFGLRIALRQRPWLPDCLLRREISYETLAKIVTTATAVAKRLEKVIHPRFRFMKQWWSFNAVNGLAIASSSFLLMLPLPIPFSNTIPAWSILLLALGMMEEDGAVIVLGYLMAGAAWTYIVTLWMLGEAGIQRLGLF